jgi:hypothetical protein
VPIAALLLSATDRPLTEGLERSPASTVAPLLTTLARESRQTGGLHVEAWYSYTGSRDGPWRVELRSGSRLWAAGESLATAFRPGPGARYWRAELEPGAAPRQWSSDGESANLIGRWMPPAGRRWMWLNVGPYDASALHEPALAELEIGEAGARVARHAVSSVVLPLLGGAADRVPPPDVPNGTLVKGSSEHVFYVEAGRLRWVPSPDVLTTRGIPWRLRILDDSDLWRLPVDLPLT